MPSFRVALTVSALSYKYASVADNVGPNFKSKNMVKNWERVSSHKKIKTPSLLGIYSLVREAFSSFTRHTCKDARFQHEANSDIYLALACFFLPSAAKTTTAEGLICNLGTGLD